MYSLFILALYTEIQYITHDEKIYNRFTVMKNLFVFITLVLVISMISKIPVYHLHKTKKNLVTGAKQGFFGRAFVGIATRLKEKGSLVNN